MQGGSTVMLVYEKVKTYLEEYGIKQSYVAKKCNMSTSTFSAMMNGKRKMYADDLREICFALNVSPEVFVDFKVKDN